MTKYHFNTETGEAGPCKAEVACPFGLPLDGHFDSLREATVGAEVYFKKLAGGSFGKQIETFEEYSARQAALRVLESKASESKPAKLSTRANRVLAHLDTVGPTMAEDLPTETAAKFNNYVTDGVERDYDNAVTELLNHGLVEQYTGENGYTYIKAKESGPLTDLQIPVEQYRALMPSTMPELGDYAKTMGLNLQETWQFAGMLYDKPKPTPLEYKQLILEGVKKHVDEAFDKTREIDNVLHKNPYFKNAKFKHRASGTVLETYATIGHEDLITRVDEKGAATFEVYDHDEGESQYSDSMAGWQNSIGNWMNDFRSHQDHLFLRVLWENEHQSRTERYHAIGKRVQAS